MKVAGLVLLTLALTSASPVHNSSEELESIDWSKVYTLDPVVTTDGKVVYVPGARIVGGSEVTRNSLPYQVAVINDKSAFCGGSLISPTVVLTAAHCTSGSSSARLIAGAHNINQAESTQQTIQTSRILNHPNYNYPTQLSNDVALCFASRAFTINQYVRTVALPTSGTSSSYEGVTAQVSGWGRTSDGSQQISSVLRRVNVPIISNSLCSQTYGSIINNGVLCTSGQGGRGSCNGDSGGPLVYNNVQVGVVSFGSSSGCAIGAPAGFARVTYFRPWISTNAGV